MVDANGIADIQALVDSGDIDLSEYRGNYLARYKKETTLTDAQIIAFIAEHEHDDPLEPVQRAVIMHGIEIGALKSAS